MPKKTLDIPPVLNGDYEYVPTEQLRHHPRNVRHSDLGAIYESIRANGFYGACIVQRSTGFILVGNHRAAAARELRIPSIPVVYVDCDDDAALRIMLSDNRTGDLASDDPNALAKLLTELVKTDKGLLGTAFDEDTLDELLSDLAGGQGLQSLADNSSNSQSAAWLKWNKEQVPLTSDEAEALSERLKSYAACEGSSFGFVRDLLSKK